MLLSRSDDVRPLVRSALPREIQAINSGLLKSSVEALAFPRHFQAEPEQNRKARDWIREQLTAWGYQVAYQGPCDNVVAHTGCDPAVPKLLIGAHYDTVPGSPGADDNASAVAALLAVAHALAPSRGGAAGSLPVVFVAFNREEEALLGSHLFASYLKNERPFKVREAHILEMVGYTDRSPGQRKPPALPIRLPERADFLGLIAKSRANRLVKPLLRTAKTYVPELPVLGLRVWPGLDRCFKVLRRSDHAPLWDIGTPAVMWTDTSEFRNPNYHKPSDTPDTLDYQFLTSVTQLLLTHALLTLEPVLPI